MNVLVTGGAGFIGSHIVRGLLAKGDNVRVLDDLSTGSRENLAEVANDIELIEADICDPQVCLDACADMEAVIHQAALGSVPRSIEDPATTHDVNVNGTINLLQAARAVNARRFVFASSSSVYGDAKEPIKVETLSTQPLSPYAASKLAAEAYTIAYFHSYDLETVALRYFNVFGPRQDPNSMYAAVVPIFASRLLAGESPTIYGDGEQTRDFTYVRNVVDANLQCLTCPKSSCGQAYNVACAGSISVNELFHLLRAEIGGDALNVSPTYAEARVGDVRHSLASVKAAERGLGYTAAESVLDGIRETVDWYRSRVSGVQG